MSDDPVEQLLDELLRAHDRQRAKSKPRRRSPSGQPGSKRWHLRTRIVAVSAAVMTVCASAAAAVVIATNKSAPLKGELPPQLLGSRYALEVTPDRSAGHGSWCISLIAVKTHTPLLGSHPRCVTPGPGPLILRGGVSVISPVTGQFSGFLLYAVVRGDVPGLREPDGQTVEPISDGALPKGWRAAVVIETDPAATPGIPATLTPIDARGNPLVGDG
jgi:hypothetical protein